MIKRYAVKVCPKCKHDIYAAEDDLVHQFIRGLKFHKNLRQLFDYVESNVKTLTCVCENENKLEAILSGRSK